MNSPPDPWLVLGAAALCVAAGGYLLVDSVGAMRRGWIDGPRLIGKTTMRYTRAGEPIRWGCSIVFYLFAAGVMLPSGAYVAAMLPWGVWPAVASWGLAIASAVLTRSGALGRDQRLAAASARDDEARPDHATYRAASPGSAERDRQRAAERRRMLPGLVVGLVGLPIGVASVFVAAMGAGVLGVVLCAVALGYAVLRRPR